MPKEAKKDLDTAAQLGKLRTTPRQQNIGAKSRGSSDGRMMNNNNNNGNVMYDSKDVESDENGNPNVIQNRHSYDGNLNNGSLPRSKRGSRISDTMVNNGNIFISPRCCATPVGLPGLVNGPSLTSAIDNESTDDELDDIDDVNGNRNCNNNNNRNRTIPMNSHDKLTAIAQTGRRMPRTGFLQNLEVLCFILF